MATLLQVHSTLIELGQHDNQIALDTIADTLQKTRASVQHQVTMLADMNFAQLSRDGNFVRLTETGKLARIQEFARPHAVSGNAQPQMASSNS